MGWLLVGFLFYIFLVVAERAIVAVTPYELEMFRAEGTPSARRILSIAGDNNRRSLAALSLSRTFLMVLMSMSLILFLFQQLTALQLQRLRLRF